MILLKTAFARGGRIEALDTVFDRGPGVRIVALLRGHWLDGRLIAGEDPSVSRKLAARAATLTSPRFRGHLADGLDQLLRSAQAPAGRWRVRPAAASILANAEELRDLVAVLRGSTPLYARGIAALGSLVTDSSSPAYLGDRDALARRLRDARAAMSGAEIPGQYRWPATASPLRQTKNANDDGGPS